MKFCYVDESGTRTEPVLVLAGILVDSHRMHVTKEGWRDFLRQLSEILGKDVREFHTTKFYRGSGWWSSLDGQTRSAIMDAVFEWVEARNHKVVFAAIQKDRVPDSDSRLTASPLGDAKSQPDLWLASALHIMLSLQKSHQVLHKNKGHTVLVFDQGTADKERLDLLSLDPPEWTDSFYGYSRQSRKRVPPVPLDQIIDTPYYADSRHVHMIQIADLFAYVLRKFAELEEGLSLEAYSGEKTRLAGWVARLANVCLPDSYRWPAKGACECANLYRELAPPCLLTMQSIRRAS